MAAAWRGKNITAISYLNWRQVGWVLQPLCPLKPLKSLCIIWKMPDVNENMSVLHSQTIFFAEVTFPKHPFKGGKSVPSFTGISQPHLFVVLCMMRPQWTCVCVHPFILYRPSLSIDSAPQQLENSIWRSSTLCFPFPYCHATGIWEVLQAHFFVFFISCHQWAKHFPRVGNGILAVTNSKSRPTLQSVLPDWIL